MSTRNHNHHGVAGSPPRSAYLRAARTNNPLVPPEGLRPGSSEARRWTDLCRAWGQRLGHERLANEGTRALLLNLISITLHIERMRDLPLEQQPHVETQLHLLQEQRGLLAQLGLNEQPATPRPPPAPTPAPLTLADHIASRVGAAS